MAWLMACIMAQGAGADVPPGGGASADVPVQHIYMALLMAYTWHDLWHMAWHSSWHMAQHGLWRMARCVRGQVKMGLKSARGGRPVSATDAMAYGQWYLPPLGGGSGNWCVARPDDPRFANREMPTFNSSGVNPAFCPPRRSSLEDAKGRVYPQPKVTKRTVLPGLTGNPSEGGCLKDAAGILKRYTNMPIAQMCTANVKPRRLHCITGAWVSQPAGINRGWSSATKVFKRGCVHCEGAHVCACTCVCAHMVVSPHMQTTSEGVRLDH